MTSVKKGGVHKGRTNYLVQFSPQFIHEGNIFSAEVQFMFLPCSTSGLKTEKSCVFDLKSCLKLSLSRKLRRSTMVKDHLALTDIFNLLSMNLRGRRKTRDIVSLFVCSHTI